MFSAAQSDRDHHQAESEAAGPGGKSMHGHNHHGPSENTDDDGRDAVQQVGGVSHEHGKSFSTELSQVNASQESDGHTDDNRDQYGDTAAYNGIGQASAGFARGERQFGEKVPV